MWCAYICKAVGQVFHLIINYTGEEGKEQARTHDFPTCQKILDIFAAHGHNELDTARVYGAGTCEQYLGKMEVQTKQGYKLATKVCVRSALKEPGGLEQML